MENQKQQLYLLQILKRLDLKFDVTHGYIHRLNMVADTTTSMPTPMQNSSVEMYVSTEEI